MVTGGIDLSSYMGYEELRGLPQAPLLVSTECDHIFSESTNVGMEDEQKVSIPSRLSGPLLVYPTTLRGYTPRTHGQSFAILDIRLFLANWAAQTATFIS